jgi:hypothetical protein
MVNPYPQGANNELALMHALSRPEFLTASSFAPASFSHNKGQVHVDANSGRLKFQRTFLAEANQAVGDVRDNNNPEILNFQGNGLNTKDPNRVEYASSWVVSSYRITKAVCYKGFLNSIAILRS